MSDSVYIETSVWGMVPPGQNPALRRPTLEFLQLCEQRVFVPQISEIVATEIRLAPPDRIAHMLAKLSAVAPAEVPMPPEAESLADRFIRDGVLPARRLDDARHVACAIVNELEMLVSWNYRHIANVRKADAFRAVALLAGYRSSLEIHTPLEVLGWK